MKTDSQNSDNKKSSSFLVSSTIIGTLTLLIVAIAYYFSTNTHMTP